MLSRSFVLPLLLVLSANLLVAGLSSGAISAQPAPAQPPAAETPPSRLMYDGLLAAPRLPSAAPAQVASPALLTPKYATWSRLAFQSVRNERDWEIYAAAGDGSAQIVLTNNPNMDVHPRFNRGATRIVFATNRRDDNYEIFAMNADGGGQTRLTNSDRDDVFPAWSPDGSKIAFQSYRDGQAEIYVMNGDGGGQARRTSYGDYDGEPSWSPDGSQIAFVRKSAGQYRIWVMNADGSNARQLSSQPNCENPVWSPDGGQIAYDADGNGDGWQELWLMDATGGNQRLVYQPGEYYTDAWARSWSPDGHYVAFTRISFVQQGGDWYWMAAYLDAWDSSNPSSSPLRLSNTGTDWSPDWQTTDVQAPTSAVEALPAQSPSPFTVRWSGADVGLAGVANFDVQVKDGAAGQWTIWLARTPDLAAAFSGAGGRAYYFRVRARDNAGNVEPWPADYDAVTTVEALPPQTAVTPLASISRNGVVVRWGGTDPGGSGIRSYDVQVRAGDGAWTDWRTDTAETAAGFTGAGGVRYGFRARGRDNAQNLEAWPAGDAADTTTTLYTWQLTGGLTDNRGIALGHTALSIAPAPLSPTQTDAAGRYLAYLTASGDHTLVISRPGYGPLSAALALDKDRTLDLYLPPQQNLIVNGGYEAGAARPTGWMLGGPAGAAALTADAHTGARALLLGQACPYPCIALSRVVAEGGGNQYPDLASDSQGNLYLLWTGYDSGGWQARLAVRAPDGAWSAPENLGPVSGNDWQVGIAVDGRDGVHVVWPQDDGVYYRQRAAGGPWSAAQKLAPQGEGLDIAADHLGGVHVIYFGGGGIGYLERLPSGVWQTPALLDSGYRGPGIAVGPDASVHFLYQQTNYGQEGVFYRWRPYGGAISPAERLWSGFGYSFYRQNLAVGSDGTVHALFHWGWSNYYSNRRASGSWSAPEPLSFTGTPALAVDRSGAVHIAGLDGSGPYSLYYRMRSPAGVWQVPVTLGDGNTDGPALAVDPRGEIHLANFLMNPTQGLYYWTSLAAVATDAFTVTASQPVTIPAGMHRPTLAANYALIGQESPLAIEVGDALSATQVFSASAAGAWRLASADLSAWAGQRVTVTFLLRQDAGAIYTRARLDDVTLGDWPTPVIVSVEPPRGDPSQPTPIVIRGMNFVATPAVRIGAVEATGVAWSDEQTLHAIVPAGLSLGSHDLWVTNPGGAAAVLASGFRAGRPIWLPLITR